MANGHVKGHVDLSCRVASPIAAAQVFKGSQESLAAFNGGREPFSGLALCKIHWSFVSMIPSASLRMELLAKIFSAY